MFTYLDIIALVIGGLLMLAFIFKMRGHIEGGAIGICMLSTISLIFFAPAIIYGLNFPASSHDLDNLLRACPNIQVKIDAMAQPLKERDLTTIYNQCKSD